MPHLKPFWQLLESRPSRTAVIAEWERVAGDHFRVVRPLLLPTDAVATMYPDPARSSRRLRVVQHTDGTVVGIDERDWQHRVPLTREDIVLHHLDLRALRKALCDSLSCVSIARTPIDSAARLVRVGNWEPKKAAAFPVLLLICQRPSDLSRVVHTVIADNARPGAILLTATRSNWTDVIEARAHDHKLMLVALDEVMNVASDAFCEAPAWEEYLQAFCQMVGTTLPSNYRNKRPPPMRAGRAADIEKLEKAVEDHLRAARDRAYAQIDRGQEPTLLPKPEQQALAKQCGLSTSSVSRCLSDKRAVKLRILWNAADSLESVLNFERRR